MKYNVQIVDRCISGKLHCSLLAHEVLSWITFPRRSNLPRLKQNEIIPGETIVEAFAKAFFLFWTCSKVTLKYSRQTRSRQQRRENGKQFSRSHVQARNTIASEKLNRRSFCSWVLYWRKIISSSPRISLAKSFLVDLPSFSSLVPASDEIWVTCAGRGQSRRARETFSYTGIRNKRDRQSCWR